MSTFDQDLNKEALLGQFLDGIYKQLDYDFKRIHDLDLQNKGIDLIILHHGTEYLIDEKAQLDYLNHCLPTFTFELSYLKNGKWRKGWLFDKNKVTDHYFLVTNISLKTQNIEDGFKDCSITSVNTEKLRKYLENIGLGWDILSVMDGQIRHSDQKQNIPLRHLKEKEGCLYYSVQKDEKPLNLKLYLKWLIKIGVAKRIYPF
ncbi:hypothetical protein [Epilithonimonas lactis]|uniref:Uncharacterized protein n=1 Tax=Epilithonimonas lactis TaxID=421072 RepID=A0A085BMG5_9FLAO|nr:hypothetical protein [Epilithonimonas lactis]KFC23660.1 hypothetical protein IO89_03545 [Epilithonimonas lactis]SEQ21058.1 hypothetical protein SAMN04488097_1677 [Epilithonimonas lactis]